MSQTTLVQRDFSVGIVRGVGPQEIDARAIIDQVDGLYEADGGAYARGGSVALSTALSSPADHPLAWGWDGYFDVGRRTVFASDDDFLVLDSDDETPINLGSDGLTVPKPSALLESLLFIGGGYIYGGSRKTANYTTGTVTLTAATYDDLGNITNETAAKTVTGSGTTWNTLVDAGMLFQRGNERVYPIASVDSTTQITLRDPYTGTGGSGISYTLTPFYKITTADPYEDGEFYAVAANRLLTGSDNIFKFSEVKNPHKWTLTANATEIPNTHTLPEGVRLTGLGVIGNTVLILTTGGIWTLNGIPFDLVDATGNTNHRVEILSRELVALGQTATFQQALIVPCLSGIFLLDGVSAPRRISRPIDELYQSYVDRPYRVGQPAIYNDHYVQPIITGGGEVKDVLVARLDRPITIAGQPSYPWSRQSPTRIPCPAFMVRYNESTGERRLFGVDRVLGQIVDCSGWWLPGEAPETDANGEAPQWVLVTRDYETGNLTDNTVRDLRPRYELQGDAEIQFEYGFGVFAESGPRLGEVNFGEFEFASVDEGEYFDLGTLGESDGLHPEHLRVNAHTRWIRYRLSCTQPRRRLRLRSLETFVRPSQAMRR